MTNYNTTPAWLLANPCNIKPCQCNAWLKHDMVFVIDHLHDAPWSPTQQNKNLLVQFIEITCCNNGYPIVEKTKYSPLDDLLVHKWMEPPDCLIVYHSNIRIIISLKSYPFFQILVLNNIHQKIDFNARLIDC